jgi:hypothetical protein
MAAPQGPPIEIMGYHLRADIRHDFKNAIDPVEYAHGTEAPDTEDNVRAFFLDTDAGYAYVRDEGYARRTTQATFTVPEETSAFSEWKPPLLYETGNDQIGMIQDAGEFITLQLGAKNVITFGSILDPAPKPVGPTRTPIWFDAGADAGSDIMLNTYGFRPDRITALRVQGLNAGGVMAGYVLPTGTVLDAIAMVARDPVQRKPINDTKIEAAGFFTSIAKAKNIEEEVRGLRNLSPQDAKDFVTQNDVYFFIGKTLGDVTLVASALPGPFQGIGAPAAQWRWWAGGAAGGPVAPSVLMLKTGDRLNWVRAILMGVGAIYEDQATNARKTKQYKFFPGSVTRETLQAALMTGFDTLQKQVAERYDALAKELASLLTPDGLSTLPDVTAFAQESTEMLRYPVGRQLGAMLIRDILSKLPILSAKVVEWIGTKRDAAPADLQPLRPYYHAMHARAMACTPPGSLFIKKETTPVSLSSKVIVANVPATAAEGEWPLAQSYDIALRNAFAKFNNASLARIGEPNYYESLVLRTDIHNRFLKKFIPTTAQFGGADDLPLDIQSISDTASEVAKDLGPIETREITLKYYPDEVDEFLRLYPHIAEFRRYCASKAGVINLQTFLTMLEDIIDCKPRKCIVDSLAMAALEEEVEALSTTGRLSIEVRGGKQTKAALVFNAYVNHMNARSACGFGEMVVQTTQSAKDFDVIENAYLSLAVDRSTKPDKKATKLIEKQSPKSISYVRKSLKSRIPIPPNEERKYGMSVAERIERLPGGGLQPRRSLYTKHVGGSAPAPRRGLYEGLRQRTGPRTTARVRQRPSNSKTRRQRDHLDRL